MNVAEIMTDTLQKIEATENIAEASKLMRESDVGFLAVVQNGKIVGTLTDRDIVVRAIAAEKDSKSTSAGENMTPDPVFCKKEDDLSSVTDRMKERKIRRLIVVDDNNNPTGTVSLGDIAARAHNDEMAGRVMDVVCGAP